jgi:hypothetical protein
VNGQEGRGRLEISEEMEMDVGTGRACSRAGTEQEGRDQTRAAREGSKAEEARGQEVLTLSFARDDRLAEDGRSVGADMKLSDGRDDILPKHRARE